MERLVFNTAEHKLEELKKYGFSRYKDEYSKLEYGQLSDVDIEHYESYREKSRLAPYFTGGIYKSINCNTNELYIKVSVYSYEQCEDDFISKDYDFYVQDLIKDGLVIKEKKDERSHCN